jgi:hypothetical protein
MTKSRKASAKPATIGSRIGTKRSDLRFRATDGSEWASPFEYKVYSTLLADGVLVRRATASDLFEYATTVKNGICGNCSSLCVVQQRTYTPDLQVMVKPDVLFYLETKGYFPGPKRSLFRAVLASNPSADIRLVAQSDHWVTKGKTRLSDWAKRFKIKFHVWNGKLPEDWL